MSGKDASRAISAISDDDNIRAVRLNDLLGQRGMDDVSALLCEGGVVIANGANAMNTAYIIQGLMDDGLMPSTAAQNDNGPVSASVDHARGAFGDAARGSLAIRTPSLDAAFLNAHGPLSGGNDNFAAPRRVMAGGMHNRR